MTPPRRLHAADTAAAPVATRYRRERRPADDANLPVVRLALVYGGAGGLAVFCGIQAYRGGGDVFVAIFVGATLMLAAMTALISVKVKNAYVEHETEMPYIAPPTEKPERIEFRPSTHTVKYAGYALTPPEWEALAKALEGNGWLFRRDPVRASGVLSDEVRDDWGGVVRRFRQAGAIDSNGLCQPEFLAQLKKYYRPTPTMVFPRNRPPMASGGGAATWGDDD